MRKLLIILPLLFSSFLHAQLTVSAGTDKVIPRRNPTGVESQARVIAVASGGTAPYTYAWRRITSVSNTTIANIIDPTNDTTDIIILPYKSGGYNFEITVTDAAAAVKKDTVNVSVTWGFTPPQRTTLRKANASDALVINAVNGTGFCRVNDIIIDGANDGENISGNKTDIFISNWSSVGPLVAGQKILIKGSQYYGNIDLRFSDAGTDIDTTGFTYDANGKATNPIIITPYNEQLRCTHFGVKNAIGIKLTGKYEAGVSGVIGWKGHANGKYEYSRGTYGIWIDNAWGSLSGHNFSIEGLYGDKRFEAEYIEIGNGEFSGVFCKNDGAAINYDYIFLHDLYIHDTHGEMVYIGSTASDPQPLHNFNWVYNSRMLYGGNEGIQFGQQGIGNKVFNTICINTSNNWKATFQADQMFGHQFGVRNGGSGYEKNIVDGSSEQLISFFLYTRSGFPSNNDTFKIKNSVYIHSKSWIGAYLGGSGVTGVKLLIDSVYIGLHNYKGNQVFNTHNNTMDVFRGVNNYKVILQNSTRDNTKTTWITNNTGSNLATSNLTVATIAPPHYKNSGFKYGFDFSKPERWADTIWNTFGDEYAGQGEKQNQPIIYALGDTVIHHSKWYVSKINGNHKHPPQGVTDAFWRLITWKKGARTYTYPPDDYRLLTTDKYAKRNIGLQDKAKPTYSRPARIRRGH